MKRFLCHLAIFVAAGLPGAACGQALGPPLPAARASALQIPAAAMPAHPAVVRILVTESAGQSVGSGTLVDVRDQFGLIVTNWHVIRDATGEIRVAFPDGFTSAARVVLHDKDWDLAALSIWNPKAAPVRIAPEMPQRGEVLTIAGYGSDGMFRAASGPCTQYLAPSDKHPHEIVELAVRARQGDSGGPIFNARGEMAGVLFGTVDNTTSGSYGGRVLAFLQPALTGKLATAPPVGAPATNANPPLNDANIPASAPPLDDALQGTVPPAAAPQSAAPLAPLPAGGMEADDELRIVHTPIDWPQSFSSTPTSVAPSNDFAQDLVGRTPIEQAKSALSLIGLLALATFAMRLGKPATTAPSK